MDRAVFSVGSAVVATIPRVGKLFVWSVSQARGDVAFHATEAASITALWHGRVGHVSASRMESMASAVDGIPTLNTGELKHGVCDGCVCEKKKMTVSQFSHHSGSEVETLHPFEIIHSDMMGPIKPKSKGSAQYLLTFIDDYSRYVFPYLLASKSQAYDRFREFKALIEPQYGRCIKCITTDNGGEYCSKRFEKFCAENGIIHQTTAPYSPQQNGIAERMNRTLMEMARAMMWHMHVNPEWWGEGVVAACHILNRDPNTTRPMVSPCESLTGERPSSTTFVSLVLELRPR